MFNKAAEKTTARIVLIGAPLSSLFILFDSVTDPVNATKLAVAGAFGFSVFSMFICFAGRKIYLAHKYYLLAAFLMAVGMINATINSDSPLTQNIYGAYGRNTGLVAYAILLMISIGTFLFQEKKSFEKIILGLHFTGLLNVLYCAWVILFGDIFSWSNPYGEILGFFGNPNFISSFLGIFITSLFATTLSKEASWRYRFICIALGLLAFFEIVDSNSIQGIVVSFGGIVLTIYFALRAYFNSQLVPRIYLIASVVFGVAAVLGTLQKGPLSFIYKNSVTLRGEYWRAGIEMGVEHPLTGVGMDSYGDWYRRARSLEAATVLPGPKTVTNASHNVVIDFFAFGGWPLLLSYLLLLTLAVIAAVKMIRRTRSYDATFVAIFSAWTCYQIQSVISINQIGLAVWGWLLTGALVSYEYATRPEEEPVKENKKSVKHLKRQEPVGVISPELVAGLGLVLGLLVASPPLTADMKWRSAITSNDALQVEDALKETYTNPLDSQRLAQAVQLYANSNLLDQSLQIARRSVEFNPNYFDAWRMLYFLPNSTAEEKAKALKNMQTLDPLNPDVTEK